MKKVTLIKIFIASPSDTQEQRDEVEDIILKWNQDYTDSRDIILMPVKWEKNATSSYHYNMSGQQIINNQLLLGSDILIALFNMKLGTPIDGYDSGTVEEIEIFYDKNKDHTGIFFMPISSVPDNLIEEFFRLKTYKNNITNNRYGLYSEYSRENIRRYIDIEVNKKIQKNIYIQNDQNNSTKKNTLNAVNNLNDNDGIKNIWNDELTVTENFKNIFLLVDSQKKFTKEQLKTVSGKRYIYSFSESKHPNGKKFVSPRSMYLPITKKEIFFETNFSKYQAEKVGQRILGELDINI